MMFQRRPICSVCIYKGSIHMSPNYVNYIEMILLKIFKAHSHPPTQKKVRDTKSTIYLHLLQLILKFTYYLKVNFKK